MLAFKTIPPEDPFWGGLSVPEAALEAVTTTVRQAPLLVGVLAIVALWIWATLRFVTHEARPWRWQGRTWRLALFLVGVILATTVLLNFAVALSPDHNGWDANLGIGVSVGAGLIIWSFQYVLSPTSDSGAS